MFIFSEEKRPKLQQERPDLSDSELTRLLARMWNELPDKKKVTSSYVLEKKCQASGAERRSQIMLIPFMFKCYLGEVQTPRNSPEGGVSEEGEGGS